MAQGIPRHHRIQPPETSCGCRSVGPAASILASSLAGQALFTHAPAPERARRVLSKLRQTPRYLQSARDNIKEPPGIFVKTAMETLRGVQTFIDRDLPRAFAEVDDLSLLGDLADAATEASAAIASYVDHLLDFMVAHPEFDSSAMT